MIKTIKHHYHKLAHHYHRIPGVGKLLLGVAFFLGVFVATFKFMYADSIPFESSLSTMFPWLNTGYYSNTYFRFGGNDFVGIIFWSGSETLGTLQNITINSGTQSINCSKHLRGIYYNNQRGRRIWPLDTGNLNILQTTAPATGYLTMTITGGFYSDCVRASGAHTPLLNEVYGQIDHTLGSQTGFRLIAGINYDFTGNTFTGLNFGRTLAISTGGVHTGYMFDTNGGIAELSMNVPWCQSFQGQNNSGFTIPQGGNTTFICNGTNFGGYLFRILSSTGSLIRQQVDYPFTGSSDLRWTGASLATGNYYATCSVVGPGGVGSQCGLQIPFQVGTGSVPPSGTGVCDPNFQGEINFAPANGSIVINPTLGTYYTNKTGITLQVGVSQHAAFDISGNFTSMHVSGIFINASLFDFATMTPPITLLYTGSWNYFSSTYTTGACTYTDAAKRVYVDTVAPTAPAIFAPISGTNICPSSTLAVSRTGSTDSGSQVGYYKYEVYNNNGMATGILLSGTVPSTATSVNINAALLPLGTHYIRILAVDNVGNTSISNTVNITTSQQYCSAGTGIMIVTPVIWLRNVNLDTVYRSDPIIILGLTGPTLVSVSKGMLFINNGTGSGTTGLVSSTDTLYIEVISSNQFDTTVSSNLNVLGLTGTFSVTTKKSNCVLSAAEKLTIQNMYETLKIEYNNDLSKLSDFLNTFQSMVQDQSDLTDSCTLEYLLSLIQTDLGFDGSIDTSKHITPNCKEYSVGYDATQRAYYAPETINRYYFINRESLIRHLDYYNPGDCHINSYGNNFRTNDTIDPMKHIAPNGKIYHLIGQYGGFSATEFASARYFDSMESIVRYIDLRNPPKDIWKHSLDLTFTPITYAAPNGREYRIYKTDRGFMSYKLMKVKYYPTLSELKNYINRNNPSKR